MTTYNLSTATPLSLLPIPAGPLSGVLASARAHLCALSRQVGIELWVNPDMEGLLKVNEQAIAAGSWDAILPAANPRCRKLHPGNAYWIDGRNADGETVTVQAGLLYNCQEKSLGQRFTDLTVFYDDPARQAPDGEWCAATSEAALALHGNVVWTNAGWTHPDWRRGTRGLFRTAQRANKLVAWLLWQPDAAVSVVEPHILPVWSERNMGIRHIDAEPTITYRMMGSGEFPMHFVLFSRAHFFGDLAALTFEPAMAA